MFSTLSKTEIIIFVTFNLSSANAFNLGLVQNFVVWEWDNITKVGGKKKRHLKETVVLMLSEGIIFWETDLRVIFVVLIYIFFRNFKKEKSTYHSVRQANPAFIMYFCSQCPNKGRLKYV